MAPNVLKQQTIVHHTTIVCTRHSMTMEETYLRWYVRESRPRCIIQDSFCANFSLTQRRHCAECDTTDQIYGTVASGSTQPRARALLPCMHSTSMQTVSDDTPHENQLRKYEMQGARACGVLQVTGKRSENWSRSQGWIQEPGGRSPIR